MAEYYMFHKPRGSLTACRHDRNKTVFDYFPEDKRTNLFHVGRLDKDTEGLLIITDDGRLCHKLMMPDSKVEKQYFFWALGVLDEEKRRELEDGVRIYDNDMITAPASIRVIEHSTLGSIRPFLEKAALRVSRRHAEIPVFSGVITITEGKKHQVKRMLGYAGCKIVYLKRISIGSLELDEGLLPGEYRELCEDEIALLYKE